MDRFDRQFNLVDPQSGKPFSYGQPDGVWLVSILFSMLILACVIVMALGISGGAGLSALVLLLPVTIHVAVIYYLFQRAKAAMDIVFTLAAIALMLSVFVLFVKPAVVVPLLVATVVYGVIAAYLRGLTKSQLLS